MAIKERKQITGTTEQINAYAGHEGQIVWDKEKKTFVGMSGIAGTNYPLAPQAYVDEGLAGKEDKGVCLPLTGGLLSGSISLDPNFGGGNVGIGYNYSERLGGGIGFRSINHKYEPGAFTLYARDLTQDVALVGKPDGTLTWDGKPIVYQENSISGTVRLSNNIMILWADLSDFPNGGTYTFPQPFVNNLMGLQATTNNGYYGSSPISCWVGGITATSCTVQWSTSYSSNLYIRILAIGRWK